MNTRSVLLSGWCTACAVFCLDDCLDDAGIYRCPVQLRESANSTGDRLYFLFVGTLRSDENQDVRMGVRYQITVVLDVELPKSRRHLSREERSMILLDKFIDWVQRFICEELELVNESTDLAYSDYNSASHWKSFSLNRI